MESLVYFCLGTSASFAVTGAAVFSWKRCVPKLFDKRVLKVSGARLFEIDPRQTRATFALKPRGEVSKVKSLGFKGRTHKKNLLSVGAILGKKVSDSLPVFPNVVEVKESDGDVYIETVGDEDVASSDAEALQRYISHYERNHKEDGKDFSDTVMTTCYLGASCGLYAGAGIAVIDMLCS
ncbi:hypothetical protein A9K97_gp469 [Tokyovirus A1]|uniref:hypothetical protein n=1 Tax=Tokyovirus A1 TaxID=1826170 RepID=UPI0007A98F7E|nr:hypothetical protein A9K97_gp469 [Tokyovirus A1]BAU79882.1 hypothetical protein [Tokyovirus A1]